MLPATPRGPPTASDASPSALTRSDSPPTSLKPASSPKPRLLRTEGRCRPTAPSDTSPRQPTQPCQDLKKDSPQHASQLATDGHRTSAPPIKNGRPSPQPSRSAPTPPRMPYATKHSGAKSTLAQVRSEPHEKGVDCPTRKNSP